MNKSFRRFSSACLLAVCLTISNGVTSGQQPTNAAASSTQSAQTVLERNVRAEMNFLASDALQGRGSATGYEHLAAEYIGSQFQQFGLEPAGDTNAAGAKGFVQRASLETLKHKTEATDLGATWNAVGVLRGVVAHTVSSFGLHTDYHRPSDEIAKIDFKLMTSSIGSMIEPVRWLANSTFRPAWVPGGAPTRN